MVSPTGPKPAGGASPVSSGKEEIQTKITPLKPETIAAFSKLQGILKERLVERMGELSNKEKIQEKRAGWGDVRLVHYLAELEGSSSQYLENLANDDPELYNAYTAYKETLQVEPKAQAKTDQVATAVLGKESDHKPTEKDRTNSTAFKLWRTITLPFRVGFSFENRKIFIKTIRPDLIPTLPLFMLKMVKPDQLAAIKLEQLDKMPDEQFKYLAEENLLSEELVSAFRERDPILSRDIESFKELSAEEISSLSTRQALLLSTEQKAHLHGNLFHEGVELEVPDTLDEFERGSEFVLNDVIQLEAGGKDRKWAPEFIARTVFNQIGNAEATNQILKQMGMHLFLSINEKFAEMDMRAFDEGRGVVGAGPNDISYTLNVKRDQVVLEAKLIRPVKADILSDEPDGYQEATVTVTGTISDWAKGNLNFLEHIDPPHAFKDHILTTQMSFTHARKIDLSSMGRNVASILPENMRFLNNDQLKSLTTEQLSVLTIDQIKGLKKEQLDFLLQLYPDGTSPLQGEAGLFFSMYDVLNSKSQNRVDGKVFLGDLEIPVVQQFKKDATRGLRANINGLKMKGGQEKGQGDFINELYTILENREAVVNAQKIITQAFVDRFAKHAVKLAQSKGIHQSSDLLDRYTDFTFDPTTQEVTITEYVVSQFKKIDRFGEGVIVDNHYVGGKIQIKIPLEDLSKGDLSHAKLSENYSNFLPAMSDVEKHLGQWIFPEFDKVHPDPNR